MPDIVKSKSENTFTLIEPGTHIARCYAVVNLGLQESSWGPKPKHYLGFEVTTVRVNWEKDGVKHEGPAIIGSTYTSSLSKKAILRLQLESWRGKAFSELELEGFDLQVLIGVPCMLSVAHTDDGQYANIATIMGLPKGTVAPPQETPSLKYVPSDDTAAADLAALPEWMQKKIGNQAVKTENPEPQGTLQGNPDDFDDDIPF